MILKKHDLLLVFQFLLGHTFILCLIPFFLFFFVLLWKQKHENTIFHMLSVSVPFEYTLGSDPSDVLL